LNGFIFLLIGIATPGSRAAIVVPSPISQLVFMRVLISVAVILVRMIWVFPAAYLPRVAFSKCFVRAILTPRGDMS